MANSNGEDAENAISKSDAALVAMMHDMTRYIQRNTAQLNEKVGKAGEKKSDGKAPNCTAPATGGPSQTINYSSANAIKPSKPRYESNEQTREQNRFQNFPKNDAFYKHGIKFSEKLNKYRGVDGFDGPHGHIGLTQLDDRSNSYVNAMKIGENYQNLYDNRFSNAPTSPGFDRTRNYAHPELLTAPISSPAMQRHVDQNYDQFNTSNTQTPVFREQNYLGFDNVTTALNYNRSRASSAPLHNRDQQNYLGTLNSNSNRLNYPEFSNSQISQIDRRLPILSGPQNNSGKQNYSSLANVAVHPSYSPSNARPNSFERQNYPVLDNTRIIPNYGHSRLSSAPLHTRDQDNYPGMSNLNSKRLNYPELDSSQISQTFGYPTVSSAPQNNSGIQNYSDLTNKIISPSNTQKNFAVLPNYNQTANTNYHQTDINRRRKINQSSNIPKIKIGYTAPNEDGVIFDSDDENSNTYHYRNVDNNFPANSRQPIRFQSLNDNNFINNNYNLPYQNQKALKYRDNNENLNNYWSRMQDFYGNAYIPRLEINYPFPGTIDAGETISLKILDETADNTLKTQEKKDTIEKNEILSKEKVDNKNTFENTQTTVETNDFPENDESTPQQPNDLDLQTFSPHDVIGKNLDNFPEKFVATESSKETENEKTAKIDASGKKSLVNFLDQELKNKTNNPPKAGDKKIAHHVEQRTLSHTRMSNTKINLAPILFEGNINESRTRVSEKNGNTASSSNQKYVGTDLAYSKPSSLLLDKRKNDSYIPIGQNLTKTLSGKPYITSKSSKNQLIRKNDSRTQTSTSKIKIGAKISEDISDYSPEKNKSPQKLKVKENETPEKLIEKNTNEKLKPFKKLSISGTKIDIIPAEEESTSLYSNFLERHIDGNSNKPTIQANYILDSLNALDLNTKKNPADCELKPEINPILGNPKNKPDGCKILKPAGSAESVESLNESGNISETKNLISNKNEKEFQKKEEIAQSSRTPKDNSTRISNDLLRSHFRNSSLKASISRYNSLKQKIEESEREIDDSSDLQTLKFGDINNSHKIVYDTAKMIDKSYSIKNISSNRHSLKKILEENEASRNVRSRENSNVRRMSNFIPNPNEDSTNPEKFKKASGVSGQYLNVSEETRNPPDKAKAPNISEPFNRKSSYGMESGKKIVKPSGLKSSKNNISVALAGGGSTTLKPSPINFDREKYGTGGKITDPSTSTGKKSSAFRKPHVCSRGTSCNNKSCRVCHPELLIPGESIEEYIYLHTPVESPSTPNRASNSSSLASPFTAAKSAKR